MPAMTQNPSVMPQLINLPARDDGSIPWRIEFGDSRYTSVAARRVDADGWSTMLSVGRSGAVVALFTIIAMVSCLFLVLGINPLPTSISIIIAAVIAGAFAHHMTKLWTASIETEQILFIPRSQETETRTITQSLSTISRLGSEELREALDNEVWRTLHRGNMEDIARLRRDLSRIASDAAVAARMPIASSREIVSRLNSY